MWPARWLLLLGAAAGGMATIGPSAAQTSGRPFETAVDAYARTLLADGKRIFRFDTLGSEEFWSGKLKLHKATVAEFLQSIKPL